MEIRAARREDCAALAALLGELAEQQRTAGMLALKDDALARDGFGKERFFQCFIAEVDSKDQSTREIVGCALYCYMYSTWEGRMTVISGLYVRPCSNREQIHEALIRRCAEAAVSTHCTRLQVEVKREDTAAISWYSKLGAMVLHEWIPVWFSRPALTAFIIAEEELEREVKSKFLIRPAQRSDVQTILYLIQVLSEYENEPFALKITEQELLRDGFGEQPFYNCFVAVTSSSASPSPQPNHHGEEGLLSAAMPHDKSIVGYALYMYTYSSLEGRGLHLEDLFVLSQHRGQGLGTVMMRECAQVALDKGCVRMQLNVLDWNTRARDLYVRIGGECHSEIVGVRFTGSTLQAICTGAQGK